jgi:hypothetical protein
VRELGEFLALVVGVSAIVFLGAMIYTIYLIETKCEPLDKIYRDDS